MIVLAVIMSLQAGSGVSRAEEEEGTERETSGEARPWPGPVPWEPPLPWSGPAPWTEYPPWPGPVPWNESSQWPGSGPLAAYFNAIEKRMDEAHALLERNILRQAVRVDNFFGSVKPEKQRQTSYNLRWRNSVKVEQGRRWSFGSSLYANFALPRISDRLQLYFSGEDEPGKTTQGLPEDPGNPGFDRTTPTTHFANTELRYELIRNQALNLFLGAGVRLVLPPEVFLRSRLQYIHNFDDILLMRVAETVFVKNSDFIGETTEFSLERLVGGNTLLRWASAGTASEEIEGLEWGSELSASRQLSPRDALTLKGGVFGNSSLTPHLQNYLLQVRYRRNFLRDWLFYELEPQITWPRTPEGGNPPVYALTFRIEVVFQGMGDPRGEALKTAIRR